MINNAYLKDYKFILEFRITHQIRLLGSNKITINNYY